MYLWLRTLLLRTELRLRPDLWCWPPLLLRTHLLFGAPLTGAVGLYRSYLWLHRPRFGLTGPDLRLITFDGRTTGSHARLRWFYLRIWLYRPNLRLVGPDLRTIWLSGLTGTVLKLTGTNLVWLTGTDFRPRGHWAGDRPLDPSVGNQRP